LARASIAAPFAALLLMGVARYLEQTRQLELDALASSVTSLLIIVGLVCGLVAVIGGLRLRSRDTLIIAGLGLFFSGGYALLTVWALVFVNTR
jgi:hypothetical protein